MIGQPLKDQAVPFMQEFYLGPEQRFQRICVKLEER